MLSDVDMDALTVQSELPLDWGACVKLLGHTRFVSRLLKLTRGTLKVTLVSFWVAIVKYTQGENMTGTGCGVHDHSAKADDGRAGWAGRGVD